MVTTRLFEDEKFRFRVHGDGLKRRKIDEQFENVESEIGTEHKLTLCVIHTLTFDDHGMTLRFKRWLWMS